MPFKRPSFLPGSERRAASKAERVAGWEARLAAQKQRYEERQARYERASRLSSLTLRCSQDAWPLIAKLIGGPSAQPKDLEVQPKDLGVGLIEVDLSGTYAVNLLGAAHILKGRASRGGPNWVGCTRCCAPHWTRSTWTRRKARFP